MFNFFAIKLLEFQRRYNVEREADLIAKYIEEGLTQGELIELDMLKKAIENQTKRLEELKQSGKN